MDFLNIAKHALQTAEIRFENVSGIQMNRSPHGGHCLMMMVFTGHRKPTAFLRVSTDIRKSATLKIACENLEILRAALPANLINSVPEPYMFEEKDGVTIFLESAQQGTPIRKLPPNRYFRSKGFKLDFMAVVEWIVAFNTSIAIDSITSKQRNMLLHDPIDTFRKQFKTSAALNKLLDRTKDTLDKSSLNFVPRHADFCTANVLIDDNHTVRVIDWEMELTPTWPFCDLLHFMSSTWCIKYGRSLASLTSNYQSMFFNQTHLTQTLQRGAIRYTQCLGLDAGILMYLSVMAWVQHALQKVNLVRQYAKSDAGIKRLTPDVQTITLINDNQCLNLEILANHQKTIFLKNLICRIDFFTGGFIQAQQKIKQTRRENTMAQLAILSLSILGILMVFFLYPLTVWIIALFKTPQTFAANISKPTVSLIIVIRNGEAIVRKKIQNALALDYDPDKLQIVFFSDGSTDKTEEIIKEYKNPRILLFSSPIHIGKAPGINEAAKHCTGEILILSDTDGILDSMVIHNLARHFDNPNIGGVCGQRIIHKKDISTIKVSHENYIKFDSRIKLSESKIGSITSNDGKLYSIRKSLFKPIEPDVTDDLYACLCVVEQGYKFSFEPEAKAYIQTPSRNPLHEIKRRRRIVARSLRGIYYKKVLLNPFKFGFFAIGLFINKVIRRLLPVCLILIFAISANLATRYPLFLYFALLQLLFYLTALFAYVMDKYGFRIKLIEKKLSLVLYFCVGMCGTLIGFIDFISLKKHEKWNPKKTG